MSEGKTLLQRFKYKETLNSNSLTKVAYLLGDIDGQDAIVTLEKLMFKLDDPGFFDTLGLDEVKQLEHNDVYSWNLATLQQSLDKPSAKVNLIYPATETHIKKYRAQQKHLVRETPEDYQRAVKPYIETMKGDRIQWVRNILFHGKEADKVVYRNDDKVNGFLLLPDMKWDGKNLASLYLVAIVLREDIASIRDLKPEHIPYLEGLKEEILSVVPEKYGLANDQLKIFFHYQPSYYHLHLHVANVAHEQMDFGKSLLIDNIIDQLRFLPAEGFEAATLTYLLGSNHKLYESLKK